MLPTLPKPFSPTSKERMKPKFIFLKIIGDKLNVMVIPLYQNSKHTIMVSGIYLSMFSNQLIVVSEEKPSPDHSNKSTLPTIVKLIRIENNSIGYPEYIFLLYFYIQINYFSYIVMVYFLRLEIL